MIGMEKIVTLATGKVKPGLPGRVIQLHGYREVRLEGQTIKIPSFVVEVKGHIWQGLELGRDFDFTESVAIEGGRARV